MLPALLAAEAQAGVTHVAVAANFTEPAKEIAALFKRKTGHEAVLSFGASGAFFTQITHGAPFEVFLSADAERPKAAIDGGLRGSRQPVHICDRQARAVEPGGRRDRWRSGAEGRQFLETVDRQSGRGALRDRRRRDDEGARRVRCAEAEDRPGQQHRAGVPVRRHEECGSGLRRTGAALWGDRGNALGGSVQLSMRRSGRTRCC